jgi:hypothetical protein
MKQHLRFLIVGLLIAIILAVFVVVDRPNRPHKTIPVSIVPSGKIEKVCRRQERVFSEESSCEITPSGLSQMQRLCAQTLTRQRARTLKREFSARFIEEIGTCQFRHGDHLNHRTGWALLTYDVEFGVGVGPSFSVSEPSLPANTLGRSCEKFGEISFSCKFDGDGKCSDVVLTDKMNFTGFQCIDGVQY